MTGGGDVSVVVDHDWLEYYAARSENPLGIAESLIVQGERIIDIGQPIGPGCLPMGQYIGLIKFNQTGADKVQTIYDELKAEYWGKPWRNASRFEKAYMTDLLQELIDRGLDVRDIPIQRGWIELDTREDYERVLEWDQRSTLSRFIDVDLLPKYPTVVSAGGVVIRKRDGEIETVLVKQGDPAVWRIPKGIQESGEGLADTAHREVLEETGISGEILEYIDRANWLYDYQGECWEEWAHFFLMTPTAEPDRPHDKETLSLKWLPLQQATSLLQFDTERMIMETATSLVQKLPFGHG
jgi:ADP-ribose pyrophosphatase YjhB (NUDIX family)